jgi:CxxC-x17-CxxC domain-containing protein
MTTNEEINFFAKTNFRSKEQPFGIKTDDRRRHFYTLGKTGMGKTSMIQNMAIQDIRSGKGVAIVDPHGEFAEECLKAVPADRAKDVIYFNPADLDFPVALNVMESVDPEYRHLVSSGLIGIFKKLWTDSWGPRLEYILRNAILALLCHPSSTLLGINRLLVDKQYREEVLSYVDDPVVSSYWIDEFSKYNDRLLTEAISPIQNKVGQFLSSGLIRNIVGQTKSAFSIREVMDEGKILIMNLSKGRIGEDSSALLGAMMITKIQLAAMSRVDVDESKRNDFYLYVDEFQNFATESFAGILSEARKYRLNLILAHQFMSQLDETVLDAVLGNVGTIVSFRVGALDTEILEKEFEPTFYANDLVNLDKYNIYLKLMIDGVSTRPFSAATLLPIDISDTAKNIDKVIGASRDRYANNRMEVEKKIMDWSGMKNPEIVQNIKSFAQQGIEQQNGGEKKYIKKENNQNKNNDSSKSNRVDNIKTQQKLTGKKELKVNSSQKLMADMQIGITEEEISTTKIQNFSKNKKTSPNTSRKNNSSEKEKKMVSKKKDLTVINCSGCGKETEINFVPDGIRPVFCHNCLKEYRREQAKIQNVVKAKENFSNNTFKQNKNNKSKGKNNNIKIIKGQNKKNKVQVDSSAVQDLIKKAMEDNS